VRRDGNRRIRELPSWSRARTGTQLLAAMGQYHAVRRGADLDPVATRLYRNEWRRRPAGDPRAGLSVADNDFPAHLPRRAIRYSLGTRERHGVVTVRARGVGS